MRRMGVLIAAMTLGLSAALTGCGSDEPADTTENEPAAQGDNASEEKPAPAEEEAEASGSDAEYCDLLQTAQTDLSKMTTVDPTKSSGALEEVAKTVNEISDAAPSEIQAHWATMADTMDKSVAALEKLDKIMKDPANVDQKEMDELSAEMKKAADDAEKASNAVVADTKERCGFALQTG